MRQQATNLTQIYNISTQRNLTQVRNHTPELMSRPQHSPDRALGVKKKWRWDCVCEAELASSSPRSQSGGVLRLCGCAHACWTETRVARRTEGAARRAAHTTHGGSCDGDAHGGSCGGGAHRGSCDGDAHGGSCGGGAHRGSCGGGAVAARRERRVAACGVERLEMPAA
jgi:hypothetical protein